MPAKQCQNGKWKWGESGECVYDSEQEANDDNADYRAVKDVDLTPTKGMIEEAQKGKEWRREFGRGGTEVGLKSANMIINNQLTVGRVKKMYAYFQRHEVDKQGEGFTSDEDGYPSNGRIAWALWGGDAGMAWSTKKRNQIAKEEEEEKSINIWDNKFNDSMEKRIINIETTLETREQEDGKQTDVVVGYGSVYNSRSNDLGGFYEYISDGAISEDVINKSDVRALINHNMDKILARSVNGNGTLKLNTDSKGLRYEFEIPDTSYGRDLKVNMANGNLSQSSFAFTVGDDDWTTDEDGNNIRTITKIDRLFDISVVTYPAYSQAESDLVVAQRGLACYKETLKKEEEEKDLVMRSLASLKIELAKRK
tara:strand:- start:6771 stop:7871 length:1101 start_codon:yes stop_codon:yes gene_type:complete